MAGTGKLSRLKNKYKVLSANSNTQISWTYHITTASTITLPDTTTLSVGDKVVFTKKLAVVPTIQRFGSTVLIKVINQVTQLPQTDTSVSFDIEAEIIFVWNGTEWEV